MKGLNRVHLGHFVLVFIVDHQAQTVSFEDYDHHDVIYRT
jgi:mRNA-degrading endonuclease RelE of RelBE toxin-antitoxin system